MKRKNFKVNYIIIFIILVITSFLVVYSTSGFTSSESYDIVIIAGQSNSVGYGTRNHTSNTRYGAISDEDRPTNNVKMYCNDGVIRNAVYPVDNLYNWNSKRYVPPKTGSNVGNSFDNCNPVGFGLSFSKEYLNSPKKINSKVLIVGCGYGGSGFSKPLKLNKSFGYWWRPTDVSGHLFTDTNTTGTVKSLYLMAKQKITDMKAKVGDRSKVVGILWHQGESDSKYCMENETNKLAYINYINTLFSDLRRDIRTLFPNSTNVPILLGGLSPELVYNRINHTLRSGESQTNNMTSFIQSRVVPSISNAHFVSSGPISGSKFKDYLEGDNEINSAGITVKENTSHVHISATSQREFGKRYAYIFNNIRA